MEHQGTKTIETERLILRKFTADDLSAIFHNWTSDEKVTEFLRWPTHKSIDITKRVLESWLLEYEKPDFYQWAIIPKEIGEPIGTISVIELNEKTEKSSYRILPWQPLVALRIYKRSLYSSHCLSF